MSLTGQEVLVGFSKFIGDYAAYTSSGAGTTTAIVAAALGAHKDDVFNGWYARNVAAAHASIYEVQPVTDFVQSTTTLTTLAFANSLGSSKAFELHRYDPAEKFEALEEARLRAFPELRTDVFDDTLTGDGISSSFDIPPSVRRGPLSALLEHPITPTPNWNLLAEPEGASTDGYTATSATISTYAKAENDLLVPRRRDTAVKVVVAGSTNGTVDQTVANMANSITAALAAGRTMTFARWVYCTTASRVTLKVVDDSGTSTSAFHQGRGWELLVVEAGISPTNATTLTARLDVSSDTAAIVAYWEEGWFYFGSKERVLDCFAGDQPKRVRRDDTVQKVYLDTIPYRGQQVRLIGRDFITTFGATVAAQAAAAIEVDESSAQILYAEATKILFERLGISSVAPEVAARIAYADGLRTDLKGDFGYPEVTDRRIKKWL